MATLNLQVATGNDDSREETNGNSNHLSDTTLTLDANCILAGFIFTGAAAAVGQTISNANLQLYGNGASLTLNVEIYVQAADTPANFTSSNNDISTRTKSTAHVTFSTTLSTSGYSTSADISTVLQEYFSRGGATGKVCIILVRNASTVGIAAYDLATTTKAAKLNFDYASGGGGITNTQYLGFFH